MGRLLLRDGYCSRQIVKELSTKYNGYSDNLPMQDYENFLGGVIDEMLRVANLSFLNVQMVTGNKPALFRLIGKYAEQIKDVVIWDKGHAQPAIGEGVMNSRYEFILILGNNPITRAFSNPQFKRGTIDNLWEISKEKSYVEGHRASFPVGLVNFILNNFAEKGDKVVVPFLGTSTTAIACHYAGCHLTGSELDEDYFKAGIERVKRETQQTTLF